MCDKIISGGRHPVAILIYPSVPVIAIPPAVVVARPSASRPSVPVIPSAVAVARPSAVAAVTIPHVVAAVAIPHAGAVAAVAIPPAVRMVLVTRPVTVARWNLKRSRCRRRLCKKYRPPRIPSGRKGKRSSLYFRYSK